MKINIPLTTAKMRALVVFFEEDGDITYGNADFNLKTANGKKAGTYHLDHADFPEHVLTTLTQIACDLDSAVGDPINRELNLIEAPKGEEDEA